MTIEEVVKALREGKKVKRKYPDLRIISLQKVGVGGPSERDTLVMPGCTGSLNYVIPIAFDWDDLSATDWEIAP